jgi:hypothetical protein
MQPEQPSTQPDPAVEAEPQFAPQLSYEEPQEPQPEQQYQESDASQPVQWQAPEYAQERRSPWWFVGFWVVAVILMALAAFVFRSWSFALLVPAMAAALMVYSHRPPRMLTYVLSDKGVYINEKLHPMSEFRSFGIMHDESIPSLMFIPVKRFRPGLTIHFPAEAGETIVDFLGSRIPMQELKPDVFDHLIRKLHI